MLRQGAIAQLVEQRTENPCVPGSIPGGTTLKVRELQKCSSLFLLAFLSKKTQKWAKKHPKKHICVNQCVNQR